MAKAGSAETGINQQPICIGLHKYLRTEYCKKHPQKAYIKKIQLIEQAIKERIVNSYNYSDNSLSHNNKKLKI